MKQNLSADRKFRITHARPSILTMGAMHKENFRNRCGSRAALQRKLRSATNLLFQGLYFADSRNWNHLRLSFRQLTIYWRQERDGWRRIRWFTATCYRSGIICLRNDLTVDIPKKFWAFEQTPLYRFELSFHESEITPALGAEMFRFCNALDLAGLNVGFDWPLFKEHTTFPQYAWTTRAKEHYESLRV